jgi:opacity protein-like surface antigen
MIVAWDPLRALRTHQSRHCNDRVCAPAAMLPPAMQPERPAAYLESLANMIGRRRAWRIICLGTLLISWLAAGAAVAGSSNAWDGPYVGAQLGRATNSECNRWKLSGEGLDVSEQIISPVCGSGSFVGGVRIGDNFQYGHVFWGLAADLDFATERKSGQSSVSSGTLPPKGTYATSERLNPDGFLMLAPRIGYAGGEWAPYASAGGIVALGGHDSSVAYISSEGARSAVSFTGGKSFDAVGWVAGGGIEWGLYGPWSLGFEYMHASLGKGSSEVASCAGAAAACEGFSGIEFENLHNAFTFNIVRIEVNYYFDYW